MLVSVIGVVNQARAFWVGFGPGTGLDFDKLPGFNRPDAGAKSRFSANDRVFAIADCINVAVRNWCDCGWAKLIFFFIKISSKFKVTFLILGLNRTQTG